MQITEPAWQDYQTATADPDTVLFPDSMLDGNLNIRVGSWYLSQKIEEMGTVYDGLRAFNKGTARCMRDPTAGAQYATWVVQTGEPSFARPV